jgi:hypothetical protein
MDLCIIDKKVLANKDQLVADTWQENKWDNSWPSDWSCDY